MMLSKDLISDVKIKWVDISAGYEKMPYTMSSLNLIV